MHALFCHMNVMQTQGREGNVHFHSYIILYCKNSLLLVLPKPHFKLGQMIYLASMTSFRIFDGEHNGAIYVGRSRTYIYLARKAQSYTEFCIGGGHIIDCLYIISHPLFRHSRTLRQAHTHQEWEYFILLYSGYLHRVSHSFFIMTKISYTHLVISQGSVKDHLI